MSERIVNIADLVLVEDPEPKEHFGGPLDGEWLCANHPKHFTCAGGLYIPVNARRGAGWSVVRYEWGPR